MEPKVSSAEHHTLMITHTLLISLVCLTLPLAAIAEPARVLYSGPAQVLYLYGDVAADGTIPSGEAEPFHQMRLDDEGPRGLSQLKQAIEEAGFTIEEAYDAEMVFNPETLSEVDVVILGSNQRRFSAEETEAVKHWVRKGGGLIAWSDSAFGGHFREVGLGNEAGRLSDNDLTVPFGMYFMTDNGAGNYLVTEYEEDHFLNAGRKSGGVRFRGEGVSPVRVSAPAIMLARLQDGGLGGGIRLNKVDGQLDPERDAALAIAEVGKGRVIGVFDRNLFWNAGEGTRLSHSDNREFAQRLVTWAAGQEDAWDPALGTNGGDSPRNEVPVITARTELVEGQQAVDLIAEVRDDDGDGREPELSWKLQKGTGEITFENNNPNGPRIRAFYTDPGEYLFQVLVNDGEYRLQKRLNVTLP